MFSTVLSATLHGLHVEFIDVEADVSNGLPMFHLVGYLSSEVKEAGERVRTAIRNAGFFLPAKKVIINLSPTDKKKRGNGFDLPIAVSVLTAWGEVKENAVKDILIIGELSLEGAVKRIAGVLSIVIAAKKRGCKCCIVPKENMKEAGLVEGITIIGVSHLKEVCDILNGEKHPLQEAESQPEMPTICEYDFDYSEIKGQFLAKRAIEVAVAGNHNILMIGPPGAGKTEIAKRIPSILPPLNMEECMELTMIYSIIGELDPDQPLVRKRPFRAVNQSISKRGLLGGGIIPKPGEISLSHKGVLFLDELAEFQRPVLENLRKPMEEKKIKIVREKGEYEFPAEFLMVAAMNPCPCGNYPDMNKCQCTTTQIQSYLGKISQPFLDRIDICVEVEKITYDALTGVESSESSDSSASIRERIIKARMIQNDRYKGRDIATNSQLGIKDIEEFCVLDEESRQFMEQAYEKMGLTARTYHKVLSVARTIADLAGKETIEGIHLREALSYRNINQKYWRR